MASTSTYDADKAAIDDVFESLHAIIAHDAGIHEEAYAILSKAKDELYACQKIKNWGIDLGEGVDVDHPIDLTEGVTPHGEDYDQTEILRAQPKQKKAKYEKTSTDKDDLFTVACAFLKWIIPFTMSPEGEQDFREKYIRRGSVGLSDFSCTAEKVAIQVLKKLYPKNATSVNDACKRMMKVGGFIHTFHCNMERCFKEIVHNRLAPTDWDKYFPPLNGEYRMKLIRGWSQELKAARKKGNVNHNHKLGGETMQQWSANKNVRPSRAIYSTRQLTFIEGDQLTFVKNIASGVEGTASLYTVSGIPYIPEGVDVCVKIWKEEVEKKGKKGRRGKKPDEHIEADVKRRRDSAVTEAILGGLDHLGIVGAFAITTEDPPRLISDYYNGGTIDRMLKRLESSKYGLGENVMKAKGYSVVDISEMHLFMTSRMSIFHAILDTMDHVHQKSRCHNDLHLGNVFLHFEYEGGEKSSDSKVTNIYVGIGDWGRALYLSEVKTAHRPGAIDEDDVYAARQQYSQLAPELIGPTPHHYSLDTDVYAIGNILNTLLGGKDDWERGNLKIRTVCPGWRTEHQTHVEMMVKCMCDPNPLRRFGTRKWIEYIITNFSQVGISRSSCDKYVRP